MIWGASGVDGEVFCCIWGGWRGLLSGVDEKDFCCNLGGWRGLLSGVDGGDFYISGVDGETFIPRRWMSIISGVDGRTSILWGGGRGLLLYLWWRERTFISGVDGEIQWHQFAPRYLVYLI